MENSQIVNFSELQLTAKGLIWKLQQCSENVLKGYLEIQKTANIKMVIQ